MSANNWVGDQEPVPEQEVAASEVAERANLAVEVVVMAAGLRSEEEPRILCRPSLY